MRAGREAAAATPPVVVDLTYSLVTGGEVPEGGVALQGSGPWDRSAWWSALP